MPTYRQGLPRIRPGDLVKVTWPGFGGRVLQCQIVHVNEGKVRFSLRPVRVLVEQGQELAQQEANGHRRLDGYYSAPTGDAEAPGAVDPGAALGVGHVTS